MSLFGKNPNGLTINTGGGAAAGGSSLFGSNTSSQPQQQSNGLFGSNATASQPGQGTSVFGSANTASQPQQSGGLFGSSTTTSQPQQSGGVFGSTTTSQPQQNGGLAGLSITSQPQQGGGLFGSNTASQPQQGGGLFGSSTTTQPQQNSTLFGSSTQNSNAQSQPGGSLFGNQTTQSQGQSGGLFGNLGQKPATSQPGSSLFGGTGAFGQQQQSQPQQTSTGPFGGVGQPQQQSQPQQNTSLFGGSTFGQSQAQPQQSTSLFGSSPFAQSQSQPQQQQQQQQQFQQFQPQSLNYGTLGAQGRAATASLFGSSIAQRPTQSLFPGPLTMGQSTTAQPNLTQPGTQAPSTVPGVTIDLSQIRGTSRFNDLHPDLQSTIEKIDTFIAQQMSYAEQCAQLLPAHGESISYVAHDVGFIEARVDAVETGLDNDARTMDGLKSVVGADAADAKRAFRTLENLKLPMQFHYASGWPSHYHQSRYGGNAAVAAGGVDPMEEAAESTDLVAYFETVAKEMEQLLQRYTSNMKEIEDHLKTVEQGAIRQTKELMARKGSERVGEGKEGGNRKEENLRELATVLREFEHGILHVAGSVGACREQVQEMMLGGGNGWSSARNGFGGSVATNGWGKLNGYARG